MALSLLVLPLIQPSLISIFLSSRREEAEGAAEGGSRYPTRHHRGLAGQESPEAECSSEQQVLGAGDHPGVDARGILRRAGTGEGAGHQSSQHPQAALMRGLCVGAALPAPPGMSAQVSLCQGTLWEQGTAEGCPCSGQSSQTHLEGQSCCCAGSLMPRVQCQEPAFIC